MVFVVIEEFEGLISPDQIPNHRTAELAELLETTGVVIGELVVVETKEAEEGDACAQSTSQLSPDTFVPGSLTSKSKRLG